MLSRLSHSLKKEKTPSTVETTSRTSKRYSLASNAIGISNLSRISFKKCNTSDKTCKLIYHENGVAKSKKITLDDNTKLFLYINNTRFEITYDGEDAADNHMLIWYREIDNILDGNKTKLNISKTCIVNFDRFNFSKANLDNSGKLIYGDTSSDKPGSLLTYIYYEGKLAENTRRCDGNIAIAIYLTNQIKPLLLIANHKKYLNRIFFDENNTTNRYYNKHNITLNELLALPNVALIIRKTGSTPDEIIKDFDSKKYNHYTFESIDDKLNIVHNMLGALDKPVPIGDFLPSENQTKSAAANNIPRLSKNTGRPKITMQDYLSLLKPESTKYTPIVNFEPPKSITLESVSHVMEAPSRRKTMNTKDLGPARNTVSAKSSMNTGSAKSSMNTKDLGPARNTGSKKKGKRSPIKGKPTRPAPPIPKAPSKTQNTN